MSASKVASLRKRQDTGQPIPNIILAKSQRSQLAAELYDSASLSLRRMKQHLDWPWIEAQVNQTIQV